MSSFVIMHDTVGGPAEVKDGPPGAMTPLHFTKGRVVKDDQFPANWDRNRLLGAGAIRLAMPSEESLEFVDLDAALAPPSVQQHLAGKDMEIAALKAQLEQQSKAQQSHALTAGAPAQPQKVADLVSEKDRTISELQAKLATFEAQAADRAKAETTAKVEEARHQEQPKKPTSLK
jgi:hypothetical protein